MQRLGDVLGELTLEPGAARQQAARANPALRWPVPLPRGVGFLSTRQRAVLYVITSWPWRGPITTSKLAELTGNPSRGQLWNQLARLRQLGAIGFRAYPVMERTGAERRRLGGQRRPSPGRSGRLLIWIPRAAREARRRLLDDSARWRSEVRNALTSTRFAGFSDPDTSRRWWEQRLRRRTGSPPGPRAGPRRGRRPPVAVRAHCPSGHLVNAGRTSWREGPPVWSAAYLGHCRVCGRDVIERLTVELPMPPRGPSPAELADPSLRSRRAATVRELLAELPALDQRIRTRLERDYLAVTNRDSAPLESRPPGGTEGAGTESGAPGIPPRGEEP